MICSGFLRATVTRRAAPSYDTKGRQSPLDGSVFHLPGSFTCEARALFLGAGAPTRAVRCAAVGGYSADPGAPAARRVMGRVMVVDVMAVDVMAAGSWQSMSWPSMASRFRSSANDTETHEGPRHRGCSFRRHCSN